VIDVISKQYEHRDKILGSKYIRAPTLHITQHNVAIAPPPTKGYIKPPNSLYDKTDATIVCLGQFPIDYKIFCESHPPHPPIWYSIKPARIEANQKMRVDAEEPHQKREQALLKMKIDADEANQKREQALLKMKAEK